MICKSESARIEKSTCIFILRMYRWVWRYSREILANECLKNKCKINVKIAHSKIVIGSKVLWKKCIRKQILEKKGIEIKNDWKNGRFQENHLSRKK